MYLSKTFILRSFRASLIGAAHAWAISSSAQTAPAAQSNPATPWSQVIARTTSRTAVDLYVDGRPLCRLPCQVAVPSGVHVIAGRGPKGSSAEQRLVFAPGATVPIVLDIVVPTRALLHVTAAVSGTLVYLDGTLVGNTNWQGAIVPGKHRLQLRRPNGELVQQALSLAAGMTYAIHDNAPAQPTPPPVVPAASRPDTVATRYGAAPPAQSQQPMQPGAAPNRYGAPPPVQQPSQPGTAPDQYGAPPPTRQSSQPTAVPDERFRGITGALFVPVLLGGASTNDYRDHCPAKDYGGYCTVGGPRGGAIAGRIGYSFGWIAPEFTAALSLDLSSGGMQLPQGLPVSFDPQGIFARVLAETKFIRIGILGGVGARMTSEGSNTRFTFSGSFGWVKRHVYVIPDSFFSSKPSYTAKSLFFDTGVLLGETPGNKIYLGLFAWFEFTPTQVVDRDVSKLNLDPKLVPEPLRKLTPYSGTQIMFGPVLGVTFGH